MILLPQSPNKMRFKRERHSREHRERIAADNRRKQKIHAALAAYESNTPRPPITLPRISIQEDAE